MGEGHESRWQARTLERYRERFPEGVIDQEKWDETALLVRDELRYERLEMYKDEVQLRLRDDKVKLSELSDLQQKVDDKISSVLEPKAEDAETTSKAEIISNIKAEGETRAKERSDNGPNEDTILVDNEKRIYGVFDGMGGSDRPAEASAMAAQVIGENIGNDGQYSSPEEVQKAVHKALEKSDKENHEKIGDGQTTATVVKIWEHKGQQYLVYGHVGDSWLYLQGRGLLKQISVDDSLTTEALNKGAISKEDAAIIDQAESLTDLRGNGRLIQLFGDRHYITGSLGGGDYSIQTGILEIKPGDKIILTSDGIHDNLPNNDIDITVGNSRDAAKELVERAFYYSRERRFRSKRDDMSAVVIEIPDDRDHFADFPKMKN